MEKREPTYDTYIQFQKMYFLELFWKKNIFFFPKKTKKHISLHLSDLLVEQFSDCHVDYINFSSYEMKKKNGVCLNSVKFPGSPSEAWEECHVAENHKKAGKVVSKAAMTVETLASANHT